MTANLKYFNSWNNQECSYFRKQEEIVFLLHITSIKLWTQGEAPSLKSICLLWYRTFIVIDISGFSDDFFFCLIGML